MASLKVSDWDKAMQDFCRKMGVAAGEAMERMVDAGAKTAEDRMRATSAWADDSGDLRKGIKTGDMTHTDAGCYREVYPMGKNSEGERLETVGFVLEYGRTGRQVDKVPQMGKNKGKRVRYTIRPMAPRPWIRPVIEDKSGAIERAMSAEWTKTMEEAGS